MLVCLVLPRSWDGVTTKRCDFAIRNWFWEDNGFWEPSCSHAQLMWRRAEVRDRELVVLGEPRVLLWLLLTFQLHKPVQSVLPYLVQGSLLLIFPFWNLSRIPINSFVGLAKEFHFLCYYIAKNLLNLVFCTWVETFCMWVNSGLLGFSTSHDPISYCFVDKVWKTWAE